MAAVTSRLLSWRDRLVALSVLEQDALLYLLAAVFALGTISLAVSDDYRQWAEMALGPYVVATVICWYASRRRARRVTVEAGRAGDRLRRYLVLGLLLTVVLVPLSVEVILRAESTPGAHVQNEVTVIEACADRVAHDKNCYLSNPKSIGTSVTSQSENSFFPYLPGMIPFGLVNATSGPPEFKDARLPLDGAWRRRPSRDRADAAWPRLGASPKCRLVRGGDGGRRHSQVHRVAIADPARSRRVGQARTARELAVLVGRRGGCGPGPRRRRRPRPSRFHPERDQVPARAHQGEIAGGQPALRSGAGVALPGGQAGVDHDPHACRTCRCGLRALEVATLEPAERRRLQRSCHAAGHTSRPGNAVRVPHLPTRPADLGRPAQPICSTGRALVPVRRSGSRTAVGDHEQPKSESRDSRGLPVTGERR